MNTSIRAFCAAALLALALCRGCSCDYDTTCATPPPKFISSGGQRVRAVTMPSGVPAVAWTDGNTLYFAQDFSGTWQVQTVYTLPPDGNGVSHSFGIDFDLTIETATFQPAICLVEGAIRAGENDVTETGVLQVLEIGDDGQWQFIGRQAPARGLGCSLTNYQSQLVVGWSGPRVDGGAQPAAYWGKVDRGGQGGDIDDIVPVPIPDSLRTSDKVPWQYSLAGWSDRLYFTFHSSNSMYGGPSAPGSLIAGYFSAAHPEGIVGLPCAAAGVCPNSDAVQDAASPTLVVDGDRILLSYISIPDLIFGPIDGRYALVTLSAPIPIDGRPLAFSKIFTDPFPASGFSGDEVSTRYINHLPIDFSAHLRMANSADGTETYLAYEGGSYTVGAGERIMVARLPKNGGRAVQDVVDQRVSSHGSSAATPVALAVAAVKGGYRVSYRNPAEDSLASVDSRVGPLLSASVAPSCPQDWHVIHISQAQLGLKYAAYDNSKFLWDTECYGTPLALPFPVDGAGDDSLGKLHSSLLEDVLMQVKLRAGRTLLKEQTHVCTPTPIDACDPKSLFSGRFDVSVSSTTTPSQRVNPTVVAAATTTPIDDQAHPSCDSGQLIGDDSHGDPIFFCAQCPDGSLYAPGAGDCERCATGTPTYRFDLPNLPPPIIYVDQNGLTCLTCDPGDPAHGVMPGILSSDGNSCSSCTPGSRLLPCISNSDCDILGDDFRCSYSDWNGRANAPPAGACLKKCTDCPTGVCEFGACVIGGTNTEIPSGQDLACRPIGCETCWNDDYCDSDADCPANHRCVTDEPTLTPLCAARPILAPHAPALTPYLPLLSQSVRDLLAAKRAQIVRLLGNVRLPNTVKNLQTPPLVGDELVDFQATISQIKLTLSGPSSVPQGDAHLYFGLSDGLISIDNGSLFNPTLNPDPFNFTLHFRPSVGRGRDSSFVYDGFDIGESSLEAHVVVTVFDDDVGDQVSGTLQGQLGPFVGQLTQTILQLIGALDTDESGNRIAGLTRCIFAPTDVALDLPRTCADGSVEELQLAHISDGDIQLTYAPCRNAAATSPDRPQ